MKHTGLMLTSLALCCSAANAADSTFSGDMLHIPHVMFDKKMYDVTMQYQAPDKLILKEAIPITAMPNNPMVKVSDKFKFKLTGIEIGSGQPYRADVAINKGSTTEFTAKGIAPAIHGKILKGDKITALGYLVDGSYSYAYSISNDGKNIAGRSRGNDRKTFPVRFDYEQKKLVPLKGFGGGRGAAQSINNAGTIAGHDTLKTDKGKPRIYNAFYSTNGSEEISIGTLGQGKNSRAYGINNNGIIVGWSTSKADDTDHIAFDYDLNSKTMSPLGGDILGGKRSFAFDVNDSNQVVGVATTADGSAVGFLYEAGKKAINLGSLDNSGYSEARAINNNGQVTGWSLTADGTYAAFLYDGTKMIKIPGAGGDAKGYGINNHGHVVGSAKDTKQPKPGNHAFLYKDGQLIDLYEMLSDADKANWKELREAYSISDDGVIVGRGRYWKDKANEKDTSMAFRIQL